MLGISVDRSSRHPLARQVYDGIRQAVLDGRIVPGQRLPSTRALAEELGVSRGTVVDAFDQLYMEGYLRARTGAGTFVNEIPERFLNVTVSKRSRGPERVRAIESRRTREMLAISELPGARTPKPFQPGLSPLDAFPRELFARVLSTAARSVSHDELAYGHAAGYRSLREAVAGYLRTARAVQCSPEQVLITNGAQHALNLVAHVLLDAGDGVWMENPGYRGARAAFIKSGLRVIAVPVDSEGLSVSAGRRTAPDARLAYATPSHQYPLGVTMSLNRRFELLDWARKNEAWVVEDDYDSEYRYEGDPLPSLHHLDEHGRTIYCGSFSKVIAPALRLGYLVVPAELIGTFTRVRAADDWHCSILLQMALSRFIEEGHFGRHVRRMRRLGAQRCTALVEAFATHLPGFDLEGTQGGLHALLRLGEEFDDRLIADQAAARGLTLSPLSSYDAGDSGQRGLVLGYAAFSEKEIGRSAKALSKLLGSV